MLRMDGMRVVWNRQADWLIPWIMIVYLVESLFVQGWAYVELGFIELEFRCKMRFEHAENWSCSVSGSRRGDCVRRSSGFLVVCTNSWLLRWNAIRARHQTRRWTGNGLTIASSSCGYAKCKWCRMSNYVLLLWVLLALFNF